MMVDKVKKMQMPTKKPAEQAPGGEELLEVGFEMEPEGEAEARPSLEIFSDEELQAELEKRASKGEPEVV